MNNYVTAQRTRSISLASKIIAMRIDQWTKYKGICKQYVGIIVADEILVEEGYNQENMSQQEGWLNNEVKR
jgi:hypothetical protein